MRLEESRYLDNRSIRIFISSTFQDMMGERDYLMRRTFPKLRQIASERDVYLTEVDLRWGITEEESKTGKVVDICLREIDNSIPFFIGIIGNRYGWIPSLDDLSPETIVNFSSINSYLEKHLSVTEMEVQYGVLERAEDLHAVFYIKSENNQDIVDEPEKLSALKKAVRDNPKYPVFSYRDPEDLSSLVERDFLRLLDTLFPGGKLSQIDKRHIAQSSFMRGLSHAYVCNNMLFKELEDWLSSPSEQELCIIGKSGMGKSSLIANWVKVLSGKKLDLKIVCHFIGDGIGRESAADVLYLISEELNRDDKPVLLILDGLDRLIDSDDSKQLRWLPSLPQGSKILFTVTPDDWRTFSIKKRAANIYKLQALEHSKRELFMYQYLSLFGKRLPKDLTERIVSDERMKNPFLLKTLLDELLRFGHFNQLADKVDWYLNGKTAMDFFIQIIKEYENDFDSESKTIVEPVLSLLAVSMNGISETDILSLTSITRLELSQLYASLLPQLFVYEGSICYSNRAFKDSVICRYNLSGADCFEVNEDSGSRVHWWMSNEEIAIRQSIISLFSEKLSTLSIPDGRVVQEIAFQYYVLQDDLGLLDFIRPIRITGCLLSSGGMGLLLRCWHWFIYECDYSFDEYIIDEVFSAEQVEDLLKLASFAYSFFNDRPFALKVYNICIDLIGESDADISQMILERISKITSNG